MFGRALDQVLTGIAVAWMDVKNDYLSLQKPAKLKLPELIGRFHCKVVFFDTKFRSNINGFSSNRLPAKLSSSCFSS